MISAALLCTLALSAPQTPIKIDLTPDHDVWVYPHAGDASRDPFLRVWGSEGKAVAASSDDAGQFSYSYLKWDVSTLPKDAVLKEARLVFTHVANPSFTMETSKANPLEARSMSGDFQEKTWIYDHLAKVTPHSDDKSIFGSAYPEKEIEPEQEFPMTIDLLKGEGGFATHLTNAVKDGKPLTIALTSKIDPAAEGGQRAVYKIYSKDAETATKRPSLKLVFERPSSGR